MRSLLKALFLNNWPRKVLSILLAITVWFLVNKSLSTTKTILNVPVKIENIPPGKTVEGIQSNGLMNRRVNLILTGNKQLLEDLNANDLEVVFDASGHKGEWIASIQRKNLRSNNPDINVSQGISRVSQQNFIIKLTNLVTEKIQVIISKPIGEPPRGYQFVDVWPYQLYVTVSGPEDIVKKLKNRGLKLTFNLNDIPRKSLDTLRATSTEKHSDVVSYFVQDSWKQISLPLLSPTPIEINDPQARFLRIDFLRYEMLKLDSPVPISLYFPPSTSGSINPSKVHLTPNSLVENRNGVKVFTDPLYVKGVSELFVDVIKDMVEIALIVKPNAQGCLEWSTQVINARALEDRYVRSIKSDVSDEDIRELEPQAREEYLRNRFRSYINRFQLYKSADEPFEICPRLSGHSITITETTTSDEQES